MNKKLMLLSVFGMVALNANGVGAIVNAEPVVTQEDTIAAAEAPAEQDNEKNKEKEKGCGCKR